MTGKKEVALLVAEDSKQLGGPEGVSEYYVKRFRHFSPNIKLVPFFVCRGCLPHKVEDFSAYIITGSHYNVHLRLDWMLRLEEFIRHVKKKPHIRMIGICFGHQIIANALGGTIGKNPSGEFIWKCGKVEISKELATKQYYKDANLGSLEFHIVQSHGYQVLKKPDSAKVMGSCQECGHEMLLYGNHILTLQGHPEADTKKMLGYLPVLVRERILTKEQVKNGMNTFDNDEADRTTTLMTNFLTSSIC